MLAVRSPAEARSACLAGSLARRALWLGRAGLSLSGSTELPASAEQKKVSCGLSIPRVGGPTFKNYLTRKAVSIFGSHRELNYLPTQASRQHPTSTATQSPCSQPD